MIQLAVRTKFWLFYYFHSMILNLSFFIFTIFSNLQGDKEIYIMFEYKLMLYLGYLCMVYITTFNMSVSFIATTFGNIISSMVINQFYQENYGMSPMDLVRLNLMIISSLLLASYSHEYQSKLKIYFNTDT